MLTIGLTGPTGAGKTTVLHLLEELGCRTVDCDALYHHLLQTSPVLVGELTDRFGKSILDHDGALDRKALAQVVFQNLHDLADLNAITHRHVVAACLSLVKAAKDRGEKALALDAIALIESGLGDICDLTVAVTAPQEVRLRRIMARDGLTWDEALQRVSAQKPVEYYVNHCDHTIINDEHKSYHTLRAEVIQLFADKLC